MNSIHDIEVKTIDGSTQRLSDFAGKHMLIVNVASKCGFTPQYKGLEKFYRKFKNKGLVILGFPCDQFGGQEPADEAEIKNFCALVYDVSFPMYAKIEVNGTNTHPLYARLKPAAKGFLGTERIKWNFTKFLVDPEGQVLKRYATVTTPEEIEKDIADRLG
jgi:glutathione peroxidase